jgi:hypothetical protein
MKNAIVFFNDFYVVVIGGQFGCDVTTIPT